MNFFYWGEEKNLLDDGDVVVHGRRTIAVVDDLVRGPEVHVGGFSFVRQVMFTQAHHVDFPVKMCGIVGWFWPFSQLFCQELQAYKASK